MEYHEIGERFEYCGVVLEVTEARYCKDCFFLGKLGRCVLEFPMYCGSNTRVDNKRISYKRVEQCKPKDMEQFKPNDMAKAFVDSFKEAIEDNKRMKDALLLFTQYLRGNFSQTMLLDCNDNAINELIYKVADGIKELKINYDGISQ